MASTQYASNGAASESISQTTASSGGHSPTKEASAPIESTRENSNVDDVLYPSDSYTSDHVYWADLPYGQKIAWAASQFNQEAKRELKVIGAMTKRDPLSPISAYFSRYVVNGMGLFVEGYVLFSVGNLTALFKLAWPSCWGSKNTACTTDWIDAVNYLEIVGIIIGQILVGIEGDWIGRRFGMVQDALVMTVGSILLTAMWGTSLQGWVICYAWSLFIYGIGVGGEYPMTSTRAMEASSGPGAGRDDRMHRGRNVAMAFLMQGWGQFFNQALLILFLLLTHNSLDGTPSKTSVQWTFRLSFGVIILPTLYLAYLRFYKMALSDRALNEAKKRRNTSGYDAQSLKLALGHYWHRVIGTAAVWFANDVVFYGSKIFSSIFIEIIIGKSATIGETWLWNLADVGVSLVGYYLGAIFIDHKLYGRKWMQTNGLMAIFIIFAICAAQYENLTKAGNGVRWFQALYFLSSFFTQFGPNTTSFLLAAEVYPTSIRSTAHGVSAATGKLGALLPAVLYNYIGSRTKFYVVFPFGLAAALLTILFVPDTTGLDLREQERYWAYVMEGRAQDYHGVAVNPQHLSLWERVVLKRHLAYDPELDRQAKLADLQSMHESEQRDGGLEDGYSSNEKVAAQSNQNANSKLAPPANSNDDRDHQSRLAEVEKRLD